MDRLSIIGIIVAISAVLIGQHLDGGHLASLINFPALFIVLGGTLGAAMLETPISTFKRALEIFPMIFMGHQIRLESTITELIKWCTKARKEGLLSLEVFNTTAISPFSKRALQLVIDGNTPEEIRNFLTTEADSHETRDLKAAKVFESMGGYSPTLGILAAVLGLIHVMGNLTDPDKLGDGIAVAFVATIYGVGFANIFFIPFAKKLKNIILHQTIQKEMIIEAVVAISQGQNPMVLRSRLNSLI